jgi:hypothetical protein
MEGQVIKQQQKGVEHLHDLNQFKRKRLFEKKTYTSRLLEKNFLN